MIQSPITQPMQYAGYPAQQVPVYSQTPAEYNAIKINIIDPKVNAPGSQQSPVYSYPTANVYTYPQAQQPVYYPQQTQVPAPAPVPATAQTVPAAPVPAPQIVNTQTINQVPPSVVPEQPAQPETETPASAQAPVAEQAQPSKVVDVPQMTADIKSDDLAKAGDTIESVAEIAQTEPDKVSQLLDTDLMEALLSVIGKDTSNLEGPTERQKELRQQVIAGKELSEADMAEANKISPVELAERNKQYALFTTAILQNALIDEFKKTNNMTPDIKDLPGMEQIVTTIKENESPMLRASALAALAYNARPEYKPVMKEIFELSQKDADENVQKVAAEGLAKLATIPDAQ